MATGYLLDTNICLYFLNKSLNEKGYELVSELIDEQKAMISVITKIELLGFTFSSIQEEVITGQFVADIHVLPLDDVIVRQTIAIRRKNKIKLPDAVIAATALVYNLTLITRNSSDFKAIENLVVANPFV